MDDYSKPWWVCFENFLPEPYVLQAKRSENEAKRQMAFAAKSKDNDGASGAEWRTDEEERKSPIFSLSLRLGFLRHRLSFEEAECWEKKKKTRAPGRGYIFVQIDTSFLGLEHDGNA